MSDPSPSGPMKPQDTLIYLLGGMATDIKSIKEGQAAEAVRRAASDAANAQEHAEFRHDIGLHAEDLAVIKSALIESKNDARESARERTQKWMARLTIPAVIIGSLTSYLLSKYTP